MNKITTKTTSMNLRLDVATRRQLQALADDLGIPATTLAVANIKQMLRSGEIRFTATVEPTPYLETLLKEVESDVKAGKNLSPVFDSVDDMFDHLEQSA